MWSVCPLPHVCGRFAPCHIVHLKKIDVDVVFVMNGAKQGHGCILNASHMYFRTLAQGLKGIGTYPEYCSFRWLNLQSMSWRRPGMEVGSRAYRPNIAEVILEALQIRKQFNNTRMLHGIRARYNVKINLQRGLAAPVSV